MKFGEKLRKYRLEKGLTQAELARKAGLGLNTICNYENGKTYPKDREVYATLAGILGINADYLHNENDDFISEAQKQYGPRGKRQAMELVDDVGGLFAGGELSEEDRDGVMQAMMDIYWKTKQENKKYTPKKYRKPTE